MRQMIAKTILFIGTLFGILAIYNSTLANTTLTDEDIFLVASCVSDMTKLSYTGKIPQVFISNKTSLSTTVASQELTTGEVKTGVVVGRYSHLSKKIELGSHWTYAILAHEITHFLQDTNGLMPDFPNNKQLEILETQAYAVQDNFSYSCTDFWGNLKKGD